MAMVKPNRVVFDSKEDLVDYVSRGLPPTKKDYNQFIASVRCPMTEEQMQKATPNDVAICETIFLEGDKEELIAVLDRVYKNNVRNRNIALGVAGGIAVMLIASALCSSYKEKEEEQNRSK